MKALAPSAEGTAPLEPTGDPRTSLHELLQQSCEQWSRAPALSRNLGQSVAASSPDRERHLAERLAAGDALRPGCSIKEAEDVIGTLTSFPVFDRLHKDGRRPPAAVAEILIRLASTILG